MPEDTLHPSPPLPAPPRAPTRDRARASPSYGGYGCGVLCRCALRPQRVGPRHVVPMLRWLRWLRCPAAPLPRAAAAAAVPHGARLPMC